MGIKTLLIKIANSTGPLKARLNLAEKGGTGNAEVAVAGLSDRGLTREHNEDAFLLKKEAGIFIVADGMGGHKGGEVASAMACEEIGSFLGQWLQWPERTGLPGQVLEEALCAANRAIHQAGATTSGQRGMGTTCIVAWHWQGQWYLGHAGDTRGYRLRGGELSQLSRDHTTVALMVEAGRLTPEQARNSPYRHRVERALGPFAEVEPEVNEIDLQLGDRLLLCSDGLWDMVEDKEIAATLGKAANPEQACQALVDRAIANGGEDNVTVVVVELG